MGLLSYLRGTDILQSSNSNGESRTLTRDTVPPAMLPYSRRALLDVSESNALRVADAYACVRVLSDAVASLPAKVYRRAPAGRVPAGDDQRLVQLLRTPSPGSTASDLFGQIMVDLNTRGNAYVGKFRSEGTVTSLSLLHPDRVQVELRGAQIVYTLDGQSEHGPEDIIHIKGMSADGLTGLSPVAECRLALSLSANLQEHAKQYFEQGSRPSGILSVGSELATPSEEGLARLSEAWKAGHGGVERMHRTAIVEGDIRFTPIAFSADDSQFLQQRELSAREVARLFRVPAWAIDAPTGDSLTYSNTLEQNRHFVTHSLRPWLVRIERAFSNDGDLCPGGAYLGFDIDGLLRADARQRAEIYEKALDPERGWMTRAEVRELEDLSPEGAA